MKEENSNTKDQEVTVTQEELRELHELEEIQLKVNQLRKSIKNRVLNGAKVEPGKIKIFIETEWWIQTTKDGIREFFGTMGNEVLAALPRRRVDRMFVRSGEQPKEQAKPEAVFDPSIVDSKIKPGKESDFLSTLINILSPVKSHKSTEVTEEEVAAAMGEH